MHSTITFDSDGLRLAGTLSSPDVETTSPAALLVSGSGPIDRDSNTKKLPIGVMSQIAHALRDAGIASFRYDKRGVGESQGDYLRTGFHDNIDDARSALDMLRDHPNVDARRLFVVGHSEGAAIAGQLASEGGIAGAILLAGPVGTGRQVLEWQAGQIAPTLPAPVRLILKAFRIDVRRSQAKQLDRLEATTDDVVRIQLAKVNARWMREFLAFDTCEPLANAQVPILAITGAKDIQVDPADVESMRSLVPTEFTGHVLDDVTHLLRTDAGPASLRTYKRQARQPIDDRLTDLVVDWIGTHATAEETI